jgi:hypothetical protein
MPSSLSTIKKAGETMAGVKTQWDDDKLWCLLNLSQDELEFLFPNTQWSSLERQQRLFRADIKKKKLVMPKTPAWYVNSMKLSDVAKNLSKEEDPEKQLNTGLITPEDRLEVLAQVNILMDKANTGISGIDGVTIDVGHWTVTTKDNEGEAHKNVNDKQSVKMHYSKFGSSQAVPPLYRAQEVSIKVTMPKPVKRDYKLLMAYGDQQIGYRMLRDDSLLPIHDEAAFSVVQQLSRALQPNTLINMGDSVDLAQLGSFIPDSNHFDRTLNRSIDRINEFYMLLRANNPNARLVEVDSNHNFRLDRYILKNAAPLWHLTQAGSDPDEPPTLSYASLANLKKAGVEFFSGYGAAEYEYAEDLVFIHGDAVRSNGSTADLYSKKYAYCNLIMGHAHTTQMHSRTARSGRVYSSVVVGCLCKTDGSVPGYGTGVDHFGMPVKKQQNWQQSILLIEDYGDGNYNFIPVYINNGIAYYNGKVYNGNK